MPISRNAILYFIVAVSAIHGILTLLFCLPHSSDGWGYAADVLKGDLLSAHHILYNPWCFLQYKLFSFTGIDPISLFVFTNIIASGMCLYLLLLILEKYTTNRQFHFVWILICAGCFGFQRYFLDNETYTMPLLAALAGTFFYTKAMGANRQNPNTQLLSIAFLCFALAVLFHQSYIFWFLSFAFPLIKKRSLYIPILYTICIALVYVFCSVYSNLPWYKYPFHDVQAGLVRVWPGFENITFTAINLIRTLIQVHGNNYLLLKTYFILIPTALLSLVLLFAGIIPIVRGIKKESLSFDIFKSPPFLAFFLQCCFAFYSVGNAEFMVMLPFLLGISFANQLAIHINSLIKLAMGTWIWNTAFFIIPHYCNTFNSIPIRTEKILSVTAEKKGIFISQDAIALHNYCDYKAQLNPTIKRPSAIVFLSGNQDNELQSIKIAGLDSTQILFTDLFRSPAVLSRASLTENAEISKLVNGFRWKHIDSIALFEEYYRISIRQ
ncbi:MAG: hypothetical protein CK532_02955 [Flavobacteriales bacterium]|nr:MAG: hypothetical protein CK532_02955 [Flavobacteriales bacterium]